ncbi:hypothetical protein [Kribbella sp. NPDC023855]|uniref:hypothetical protein n=1 Tax=Kribbella sp. NPDC023855 TaxID=3154698 RepID=UPI0033F88A0F
MGARFAARIRFGVRSGARARQTAPRLEGAEHLIGQGATRPATSAAPVGHGNVN